MYGITYNNKHSFNDLGLTVLNTRLIQAPSKAKVSQTIPFMNGSYDFSNLYGSTCYTDRVLEYEFLIKANDSAGLELKRMDIESWLLTLNEKTPLIDDNLKDFYYLAECINTEFEEINNHVGKLKAHFEAYPFKFGKNFEGHDIWDDFNFELDIQQEVKFDINSSKKVSIYNIGLVDVIPTIITTNNFKITKDSITYSIPKGEIMDHRFILKKSRNDLVIVGDGVIEFRFRKEVL